MFLYENKETSFSYAEVDFISSAKSIFTWKIKRPEPDQNLQKIGILKGLEITYPPIEKILLDGDLILDTNSQDEKNKKYDREVLIEPLKILPKSYSTSRIKSSYVKFNLSDNLDYLEDPDSITISKANEKNDWNIKINASFFRYFSGLPLDKTLPIQSKNTNAIKKAIIDNFQFNVQKVKICSFSPIEDFRLNRNFNIYWDSNVMKIENLLLEFKVKGVWMPWSHLSDGTKRIFYLLHEVARIEYGIVLIDEPELGIHPHQFHQVMKFLKQESEEKQIIMSTHSPQALDFVAPDELDHIFIASYTNENGTQIQSLTAEQQQKARSYMNEELFLRDYWIHADLEI